MTRKEFLAGMSASAALGLWGEPEGPAASRNGKMIWSMYQQLGSHMWESCVKAPFAKNGHYCGESTHIDDENMPRPRRTYIEAYLWLDQAGYDQIPCCGNYLEPQDRKAGLTENKENIDRTLAFCKERLTPSRLIGFTCACRNGTSKRGDPGWFDACDQFAAARKKHW